MAEDWAALAAEVDEAIRSVADIGQPEGYPAALLIPADGASAAPGGPPTGTGAYATVYCLEGVREIRDMNGSTILQTLRTLTISATGQAPAKGQQIAVGVTADDVTNSTKWSEIAEVRPLSPAGVAVLYEVDLVA